MSFINPQKILKSGKEVKGALTKGDYLDFQEYKKDFIRQNNLTTDQIEKMYLNYTFARIYSDEPNYKDRYANFKKLDVDKRRAFLRLKVGLENTDNYNDSPYYGKKPEQPTQQPQVTTSEPASIPAPTMQLSNAELNRLVTINNEEDKYGVDIADVGSTERLRGAFEEMKVKAEKLKPSFWEKIGSGFDLNGQMTKELADRNIKYNQIRQALNGQGITDWVKQEFKLTDADVETYNKNQGKISNQDIRVDTKDVPDFAEKTLNLAKANSPIFKAKNNTRWLKEGEDYNEEDLAEQYRQYLINKEMYGEAEANHKLDNYFRDIVSDNETFLDHTLGSVQRFGANFIGGTVEGAGFVYGLATAPFRPEDNVKGLNAWQNYWQKVFINDVTEYGNKVAKYGTLSPRLQEWAENNGGLSTIRGGVRPSDEVDGNLANQIWSLYTVEELIGNAGYTAAAISQGGLASATVKGGAKAARRTVGNRIKNQVIKGQMSAREGAALLRQNIKNINKVSGYVEAAIVPQVVSASESTANCLETYDGKVEDLRLFADETINEYHNNEIIKLEQAMENRIEEILNNPALKKKYEEKLLEEYRKESNELYNSEGNVVRLNISPETLPNWEENLANYIRVDVHNNEFLKWIDDLQQSVDEMREDAYDRLEGEARLAGITVAGYTQMSNALLDGMFRKALYPLSTQRHMKNIEQKIKNKTNKILKRDPEAIEFRRRFEINGNEVKAKEPTKAAKVWAATKEGLSEAVAENQQTAADKAAQGVAKYDIAQYIDARFNGVADDDWSRDYSNNYSQFFKGLVDAEAGTNLSGFGGSAEDLKEVWFSTFMGAMSSFMPTPMFNRNFNLSQRQQGESTRDFITRVLPISFRTSFVDGVRALDNTYEASKQQAEQLTEFLNNGGNSLIEKGNGAKTWAAMANIYADENNDFGMRTAKFKSLCESMLMLNALQGTETGKAILNELQQIANGDEHSKALINELVNEYKVNQRDIIKEGTQVENDDVEELQADTTGELTDEEIAEQIQTNVALALQVYEDIQTAVEEVKEATQGGATEDVIQSLAASQLLERNLSDRQQVVEKNLGGNTTTTASNAEVNYIVDYGTQEKAKEDYNKAKEELAKTEKALRKGRKQLSPTQLFEAYYKTDALRRAAAEAKEASKAEWDSNRVYSADEIMAMNPQDREKLIKNKNKVSEAQQEIIEKLIIDKTISNPKFMSEIEEASKLDNYLTKIRQEFASIISNPRDMNIYAGRSRQERYNRNLQTKYEHLGDIKDYALFVKMFEENLNKDIQEYNMARRIADNALKDNANYKRYKQINNNSGKLKSAINNNALFKGLSERQKQLASAVIDWLTKNNIPINIENGQIDSEALTNSNILGYLSDNLSKLNEDLSANMEVPLAANSTEALDAFRTMLGIKDDIDRELEEVKARAAAIKQGAQAEKEEEGTTPEPEEAPTKLEEEPAEGPSEPEESGERSVSKEIQLLKEEKVLDESTINILAELSKVDSDLVLPISEVIKVSLASNTSSQLNDSWNELLNELINSKPNDYIEALSTLLDLVNKYKLTDTVTSLHFQQQLELINDVLSYNDEEDMKKQLNRQLVYQSNTNSNVLAMAEVGEHLEGVLGKLYQEWGIDDFLYPRNPVKGLNNRSKIQKSEVYYMALPSTIAEQLFGSSTLKRMSGYPVVAVIKDVKGPVTVTIKGEEVKVQPIGFIVNNDRLNLPGGAIATAIRKAAFNMISQEGFTQNTIIADSEGEPITTKGVTMQQFNRKSVFSGIPKSVKDLFNTASRKRQSFKGYFFNRVFIGPTRDKEGKITKGKSLYYQMNENQQPLMLMVKPLGSVTKEIGNNKYTLEEIILWDDPTAIEAFATFNSRLSNYFVELENASEDKEVYAVDENAPKEAKDNAKKRLDDLQTKLNRYIYLNGKNYELLSKLENGDQNIYISYSPDGIDTVEVKLFTIKSSNPNTEVDNTTIISQFKEALKNKDVREIFHFQVDYDNFPQTKDFAGLTEAPRSFNSYLNTLIEDDLLEVRATSLSPSELPTTNLVSGSSLSVLAGYEKETSKPISDRLREMQQAEREKQDGKKEDAQPENTNNAAQNTNPSSDEVKDTAPKPEVAPTEAPAEQEDVESLDFSGFLDPSLRVATADNSDLFDRNKELAWLQSVLPQMSRDELIRFQEGLIRLAGKPAAWGAVSNALAVLSDEAAPGTVYHEAFHVVFQNILDEDRRMKVLKEARALYERLSDEQLEEKLADEFMKFVENSMKPSLTTLGGKIREFFLELRTKILNWVKGKNAVQSLYRDINNGKFAYSDIHIQRTKSLMDVRESDITDFMEAVKNTDANSLGTLWENIFGNPITEEQVKALRAASFNDAMFNALVETYIRQAKNKLSVKLNGALWEVKSYDNTPLQKKLDAINNYRKGQKLTKSERKIIEEYIKTKGRTLYWTSAEINNLTKSISENNRKREELLSNLKTLAIREQVLKQPSTAKQLRDVLVSQKENIREGNINGKVIAEQVFSPKSKVSLREITANDLSIERYSPSALQTLQSMGIDAETFNNYPNELKDRIRHCCKL